eukprot:CAMPEP_0202829054 /NCGR_PEP_ID=MMETSP1389-20130828/15280_1 /ASSEMBLY_ACC=CAM_ASM_000865 /TAXON_ID=302021 /ORGANISM="Rhodomonas sp., Strain CCMP768" /LENGTH=137 /DNA_ID=CAMNT_0049502585 /DNA_START=40 /DNA_END=454 /DNA_ORIENTATION=+
MRPDRVAHDDRMCLRSHIRLVQNAWTCFCFVVDNGREWGLISLLLGGITSVEMEVCCATVLAIDLEQLNLADERRIGRHRREEALGPVRQVRRDDQADLLPNADTWQSFVQTSDHVAAPKMEAQRLTTEVRVFVSGV